eukprot:2853242-Rhodomonas_salina.1
MTDSQLVIPETPRFDDDKQSSQTSCPGETQYCHYWETQSSPNRSSHEHLTRHTTSEEDCAACCELGILSNLG